MEADTVIGSSWDMLFPSVIDLPISKEKHLPKPDPNASFLPEHTMLIFGKHPGTDPFYTLVCDICSKLLMPAAMPYHLKRHGDDLISLKNKAAPLKVSPSKKQNKSSTPSPADVLIEVVRNPVDIESVTCSECGVTIPSSAFRRHVLKAHSDDPTAKPLITNANKFKTGKKYSPLKKSGSKSASVSPPDLTEELSRDGRKSSKIKKCKSPIPPELEPILPAAKRVGAPCGPPELYPIDLPKKSSKKKTERKVDRIYDPNKNCGVINDSGKPCLRSILCKAHLVAQKRAVLNRAMPYDALTKLYKMQNEEDWRPKLELPVTIASEPPPVSLLTIPAGEVWTEPILVGPLEPSVKRIKTAEIEDDHYADLPSDDEALIEATLKDLEEREPLLRWSMEAPVCPPTIPPPMYFLPDLPWHSSHPKPLATNTFGCRLVGGLMTKCKKLDAFRKHVQSVWGGNTTTDLGSKFVGFTTKGGVSLKKSELSHKRKRKGSGSEIMAGLLQRATLPTNGVSRGIFPNISANPASFIQLNICSSK